MVSESKRPVGAIPYPQFVDHIGVKVNTVLLIAVFFCGIFEGAFRKWLLPEDFPELSYVAYLSKFIVFWLISVASSVSVSPTRVQNEFKSYLQAGLALLFFGGLLSAFSGFSVAGAVLTIVMVVVGPVLAYTVAPRIQRVDVTKVLRWIAVMSIVPAALGVIQFDLPVTHILNKYVGETSWSTVVTDLGRVRATGTFSFITGMSAMAVVCVWSGLCLRILNAKKYDRALGLFALFTGFACGFAALSRSAIFMILALLAVRLLFIGRDRQVLIIVLVGALGYGYLSFHRPTSRAELDISVTNAVFVRHARADSVMDRFTSLIQQFSDATSDVPLGNGLGLNQIGGQAVDSGHRALVSYEAELARLVAEVGVLGVLGVVIIRLGLLLALFHAWRSFPASALRDALLLTMVTIAMFLVGNTAFNHVAAGFVWPIAAIALAWSAARPASVQRR